MVKDGVMDSMPYKTLSTVQCKLATHKVQLVSEAGFMMDNETLQVLIGHFVELKDKINAVKMDINDVKTDISNVKTELKNDMKSEISAVRNDIENSISAVKGWKLEGIARIFAVIRESVVRVLEF
jgi:archaellum component FlaC